jgi:hypothetical protein
LTISSLAPADHSRADTHALWQIALGMGAVVLTVVIILMMLLLSLVKDIQASVASLLTTAPIVSSYTENMNALTDGYIGAGETL